MSAIFVLFTFRDQLPWCHRIYSMMHKLRSCAIHLNFHRIRMHSEMLLMEWHEQNNTNWIEFNSIEADANLDFSVVVENIQMKLDVYLLCLVPFRNHILVRVHTASYCNWMLVVNWFQMQQKQFRYDLQCGMHSGIEAFALLVDDHESLCI